MVVDSVDDAMPKGVKLLLVFYFFCLESCFGVCSLQEVGTIGTAGEAGR